MCTHIQKAKKWLPWQCPLCARHRQYLHSVGRPLKPPSITNCLVAIVLTKPVIAILVSKLVAMATSLSTSELPSNTIPWANPSPQPKRHLDRFNRFCTAHRRVSLYFTTGRLFSSQNCPFQWGSGTPSNAWFLGPPEPQPKRHLIFAGHTTVTD